MTQTRSARKNNNLIAEDFDNFARCFITPEILKRAKIFRADSDAVCNLLGRKIRPDKNLSGIVFPYYLPGDDEQKHPRDYRVRLDYPEVEKKADGSEKIKAKYLTAYASRNKFYFAPGLTIDNLKDRDLPIVIGEGPKQILALFRVAAKDFTQLPAFIPVGLSGVWNFKDEVKDADTGEKYKRPFADFGLLTWQNRKVIILFDADTATNPHVLAAQKALAETLKTLQANVHICPMPLIDEAKGIDDLLHCWERSDGTQTAIRKCFELLDTAKRFEPNRFNLINGLSVYFEKGERRNTTVNISRDNQILQVDSIILEKANDRRTFIDSLNLFDSEADQVDQILKFITTLPNEPAESRSKSDEVINTSFQVLKDARVIEQIHGGFAVYVPESCEYCILESVEDSDGVTYKPDEDELLTENGGVYLADELIEYESEASLDADIENYLRKYVDVSDLHRKMTAKYIRFTYLFDKTYELPYITATGEGGAGKTRLGELVCFASRRGLVLINPSAASLFRIIDKYQPTLFLDELNLTDTGEDTLAILQVLNSGIKKNTGFVPRQEKGANGNFQTKLYKTFSPKIIGSLKKTNSQPFNSRCIEIEMEATRRTDISFRTTSAMLEDARILRNKLTLYRLRQFSHDFEAKLAEAENEMKAANLKPRTIQVNTPLLAITDEKELKAEFIELLKNAENVRARDRLETLEGEIVQAIHSLIFYTHEDLDENEKEAVLNLEDGKLCQDLRVESVLEIINADRKEKDKIDARRIGQLLKNLKIQTAKILLRVSPHREKKAIVFEAENFRKLFEKFSLSSLPEITCHHLSPDGKSKTDKGLFGDKSNNGKNDLSPNNSNHFNTCEVVTSGDKQNREIRLKPEKDTAGDKKFFIDEVL